MQLTEPLLAGGLLGGLISGFAYFAYAMSANERALKHLERNYAQAEQILEEHGLGLSIFSWQGCAPCEVRFSTISDAKSGISSRKFLRLLRKRNFGKLDYLCNIAEQKRLLRDKAKNTL